MILHGRCGAVHFLVLHDPKVSTRNPSCGGFWRRYLHEDTTYESNSSSNVDWYEAIACISIGLKICGPLRFQLILCEAQRR
jgi:hypothetical protein